MTIRKPIDIIRQIINQYGERATSEQIIDALEACGWRLVYNR